jgi:hypothetical protein
MSTSSSALLRLAPLGDRCAYWALSAVAAAAAVTAAAVASAAAALAAAACGVLLACVCSSISS